MGGDLVSINTQNENANISAKLESTESHWIGLKRSGSMWKWVDGSTTAYFQNWLSGQPNNINEECVLLDNIHKWHDATCELEIKYICEIPGMYDFFYSSSIQRVDSYFTLIGMGSEKSMRYGGGVDSPLPNFHYLKVN